MNEKPENDEFDQDALLLQDGETPNTSLSERRNPRIYAKTELVHRLVKLGVPDDTQAIGSAINSLAEIATNLGLAVIPDATDAVILERALADRLDTLNRTNLLLFQTLTELGAVNEYRSMFLNFKNLVKGA
jgi:hypothetical protein